MRFRVVSLVMMACLPAAADTHFRIALKSQGIPNGKERCDIRLQVDQEIEITVRGEMAVSHTLSGQDARDDGSECTAPLPDRDVRGFHFEGIDGRGEVRLMEPPSARNDFGAIVRVRDSADGVGRYHFRLMWNTPAVTPPRSENTQRPRGPDGFAWNNATHYRGQGAGESLIGDTSVRLGEVSVDIDLGGKIVVWFLPGRSPKKQSGPAAVFTGAVMAREGGTLKADMVNEDRRLHGTMTITLDDRQNVGSIRLDATDGRDRLHLTWDRR